MTDQDKREVALAILLWRNVRKGPYTTKNMENVAGDTLPVSLKAIDLAKKLGVKDEFFTLLFEFPVMTIRVKELEEWTSSESATLIERPKKPEKKKKPKSNEQSSDSETPK